MGDTDVIRRSDYEYPQEMKAEAVAIAMASGNCSDAYRELEKRYPDRHPGRDLIWRWCRTIEPERFSVLQQERKEAVQNRAVDLALLSADKLEEELEAGNIKGQPLAITTGINMDKVLRMQEIEQRTNTGGGFRMFAALVQRRAQKMLDGTDTETEEIIAIEGCMD